MSNTLDNALPENERLECSLAGTHKLISASLLVTRRRQKRKRATNSEQTTGGASRKKWRSSKRRRTIKTKLKNTKTITTLNRQHPIGKETRYGNKTNNNNTQSFTGHKQVEMKKWKKVLIGTIQRTTRKIKKLRPEGEIIWIAKKDGSTSKRWNRFNKKKRR